MWWAEGNGESEQRRDQKGKKLGEGKMEEKRLAEEKERMGRRDWWRRRWRGGRGSETRGREDGEEGGVKETGREDGEGKVVKKEEKTSEYGWGMENKGTPSAGSGECLGRGSGDVERVKRSG